MLIGLLSDTHIPDHAKELPAQLKEIFQGVDLILHAGDIYDFAVLDELERIAPILASTGDDDILPATKDSRIKWEHILNIDGVTIWLKHILWWRPEHFQKYTDPANPEYEKPPDVIIYGHTHAASVKHQGEVILVNPGSPTFPHYKRELGSVGLLTTNSGKVDIQIIQLK